MKIMKLNRIFTIISVVGLALSSCESELTADAQLGVNVATSENATFDGQTITVKAGTPVEFQFSGEADFLTFFSGESGAQYRYKDRTEVDLNEISSSRLQFSLQAQYGKPTNIMQILISDTFEGLATNDFKADSVLVETHEWQTLIPQDELPKTATTISYDVDMTPYLGKRIAIALRYEGIDNSAVQSRFQFNNMAIVNTLTNGLVTNFSASSFGFTALNMYYTHPDVLNVTGISGSRVNTIKGKPYGTATNNTSGVWNLSDTNAFFIHSSPADTPLMYAWLVSSLIVPNGCTPDSGTGIKNISQRLDSYTYTYATPGTYTATFVATNGNYKHESQVVKEYTVVVTE